MAYLFPPDPPRRRRPAGHTGSLGLALVALSCVALGAALVMSRGSTSVAADGAGQPDRTVYRTIATVLQRPGDAGPKLCFAVLTSRPPQCGGPTIIGWSWESGAATVHETAAGVTWGEYVVTGTFTGGVFTLSRLPHTPSATDRAIVDRRALGPAKRIADPKQAADIERRLLARPGPLLDAAGRPRPDPGLVSANIEIRSGQLAVHVILDRAGALQASLDQTYGAGIVRVNSLLIPVAAWR